METNNDAASADPVPQQLDKAYVAEAKGKLDDALRLCDEIIEANPDLAEVYNLRGIVLDQLGQKKEALESYDRAVKLDPEFEEAAENFADLNAELEPHEVQEEVVVYEDGIDAYKKDAIYVAKWGALAFGLSFGIFSIITEILFYVNFYILDPQNLWQGQFYGTEIFGYWLRNSLEYIYPKLLIGLATAVLGSVSHKKPLTFGLAGGLGYAIAVWFGWGVVFQWAAGLPVQMTSFYIFFLSALASVVTGAIFGAFVGLVTKDKRQIGLLILVGALGFFFEDVGFRISMSISPFNPVNVGYFGEPNSTTFLINSFLKFIMDVMTGALIGALLGGVLGWFAGEEIVEEDDDARFAKAGF